MDDDNDDNDDLDDEQDEACGMPMTKDARMSHTMHERMTL